MSIAQSILANPSKYSLAQLTQGVQNGVIPAYIGIPIIQEKMQEQARMQSMGQGQGQPAQPPVAEQIMAQAQQGSQGVESLPSNLPQEYAGGGIIAFEEGGPVERFQVGGQPKYETPFDRMTRLNRERAEAEAEARARLTPEQRIRQDRASMMQPIAAAGDIVGGPYNFLAQTGESLANAVGIPRIGKALGIYDKDVTSVGIPRIGQGGNTPFMDMTRRYAAGQTAPIADVPYDPATATRRSQYPEAPPAPLDGGIATLPGAGQPTTAPAAPAQTPFVMPAAPTGKSAEDFARTQFAGLGERSDARMEKLLAAQAANKMEGKAFDGLKKTLEDEAAQAGVEKSDAKAMAIFKAGLAIMGGTSTNALENISRGALAGAEDLQKANADLKKAEKERQRQFAAIEEARRAEDRDDIKTRNARLETAYKAGQRMDELGSAAISAGFGVDKTEGMGIWKTQFSAAATQRAAETGAAATRYSADRSADSRVQAAELRAALLAGGGGKGAFTQDQLFKNRQALADSPEIAEYKKQLIAEYGKNVVNQPRFQKNINERIDQLLMQRSAQPGADLVAAFMAQNPSYAEYFKR
jgi:hypothetical protein